MQFSKIKFILKLVDKNEKKIKDCIVKVILKVFNKLS